MLAKQHVRLESSMEVGEALYDRDEKCSNSGVSVQQKPSISYCSTSRPACHRRRRSHVDSAHLFGADSWRPPAPFSHLPRRSHACAHRADSSICSRRSPTSLPQIGDRFLWECNCQM